MLRSGGGIADAVLADGTQIMLDAASTRPRPGRSPSALFKRGDLARVRIFEPPKAANRGARTTKPPPIRLPSWRGDQIPRPQAALISLDYDTDAMRALSGDYSFAGSKFNRATQARR